MNGRKAVPNFSQVYRWVLAISAKTLGGGCISSLYRRGLTRASCGYFRSLLAEKGEFRPLRDLEISESYRPIFTIQTTFNSPHRIFHQGPVSLTSKSPMTSQVRSDLFHYLLQSFFTFYRSSCNCVISASKRQVIRCHQKIIVSSVLELIWSQGVEWKIQA